METSDKEYLDIIKKIDKDFKNLQKDKEQEIVSFGSLKMDKASGIGGMAYGKLLCINAWESVGKSTLCTTIAANVQKQGKRVLYIDSEQSFDKKYAQDLGLSLEEDKWKIYQPDYLEQALDYACSCARNNLFSCIIIDSQTALIPKKSWEGDTGDSILGVKPQIMSRELPKLVNICGQNNILLIITSQFREKIGAYGNPTTISGGNALKFYSHMTIEMSKIVKKDEGLNITKFKMVKNKLAPPYGSGEFEILWGQGIDTLGEIIDMALEENILVRAGAWYKYQDANIGQGRENTKQFLVDNPEVYEEIKNKLNS